MTTDDDVVREIEHTLNELTDVDHELRGLQGESEAELKKLLAKYAPLVDPLTERREALLDILSDQFQQNRRSLTGTDSKIAVFRSGTLQARMSPGKLVVLDEGVAIAFIKRVGKLRVFTRIGKRTLDKKALAKDPDFVAKTPGIQLQKAEHLTIRLVRTQTEIVRNLLPYRKPLPVPKSLS